MTTQEDLGRLVRQTWVKWAREQPFPKPSWLVAWEQLGPEQRDVDVRIGEAVATAERERWLSAPLADRIGEAFLKVVDEEEAMDCLEALAVLLREQP